MWKPGLTFEGFRWKPLAFSQGSAAWNLSRLGREAARST
jgi:hypothetical protein